MMDRDGIATAMVSVPSVWMGGDLGATATLARELNEYVAQVAADHPGRFGLFACLPVPDVEASLREIEYAFDTLKADGVIMMTSYRDRWLGDAEFAPVLDELNRRKAIVYIHPCTPACCAGIPSAVGEAAIEFGTDTTRAIASVLFEGTVQRCRDIRFIFSHCGGSLTSLVGRFIHLAEINPKLAAMVPDGVVGELVRMNYDIAQAAYPATLGGLMRLVPTSQILFGTDFPWRTGAQHSQGLIDCGVSPADIRAIERDNALKLIPRLATA
jgi:predicted TIM-barrel fold metal-dependent hydrolase